MNQTTDSKPLKYAGYSIVFQEVPNETTLAISISGCPHRCEGCHSEYLWEYEGEYLFADIDMLLHKYADMVSCVCFMGGDQNIKELTDMLIRCKMAGYKTCLYSGRDDIVPLRNLFPFLDYLKIGSYKSNLGGLQSSDTNQIFYRIDDDRLYDITNLFKRKGLESTTEET